MDDKNGSSTGDFLTVSQKLGGFVNQLSVESLSDSVVDKAKALLIHGLFVGLASHAESDVSLAESIAIENSRLQIGGARLFGHPSRVSRNDAAFANSVLIHARGQDDSFRMLTHPGCCIIPAVLAEAEGRKLNGRDLLIALISGYEVHCRLAKDLVPSVQNQAFRSSALFGVFGPTAGVAKLKGLNTSQIANSLALAVSFALGNLETSRAGTREMTFQEPLAVQAGMLATALAERDVTGAPECFEGKAGFFYAFAGSAVGKLSGSFDGKKQIDVLQVTEDLGSRWELLNVTMKIYSGAGFVQPIIEGCAQLAREYDIIPEDIRSIDIEMNEWETIYPSPRFPRPGKKGTDEWDNAHFAAEALIGRGYPSTGRRLSYGGRDEIEESSLVKTLSRLVHVTAGDRPQYGPVIMISLKNGRVLRTEMTGDEFKWDLQTECDRIQSVYSALPFNQEHAERIVDAVRNIESLESVDRFIDLVTTRP